MVQTMHQILGWYGKMLHHSSAAKSTVKLYWPYSTMFTGLPWYRLNKFDRLTVLLRPLSFSKTEITFFGEHFQLEKHVIHLADDVLNGQENNLFEDDKIRPKTSSEILNENVKKECPSKSKRTYII